MTETRPPEEPDESTTKRVGVIRTLTELWKTQRAPLLILVGIVLGTGMDLVFEPFQVILLGLATAVVAMITLDGETHWFEGVQLLAVYAMIAVAVFFI